MGRESFWEKAAYDLCVYHRNERVPNKCDNNQKLRHKCDARIEMIVEMETIETDLVEEGVCYMLRANKRRGKHINTAKSKYKRLHPYTHYYIYSKPCAVCVSMYSNMNK